MFATGGRRHGCRLEPCPSGFGILYPLLQGIHTRRRYSCRKAFCSFREFVDVTATLRYEPCTQFINVSQRALHIYFIDGCRRIKIERNNLLCEQAPTEVFRSIFAWLVTLKLVWCKNSKNNEFRTKKFPNPEFLYGISSFCTLSENNSFLHGKISCFCIFLEKNSVFNTNGTPRVTLHQLRLAACSSQRKNATFRTMPTAASAEKMPASRSPRNIYASDLAQAFFICPLSSYRTLSRVSAASH